MSESFPDHHIHTLYSRCCHDTYDLSGITKRLNELKMPYICVSDHIHLKENDDSYFPNHIKAAIALKEAGLEKPIFLGAEMTILDKKGHLPSQNSSKGNLCYKIIGDHYIPETKIQMGNIKRSKRLLKRYFKKNPDKLNSIMHEVNNMYIAAIKRNNPNILVHPYSTFVRCSFTHQNLIEQFHEVCEVCQDHNTAIEFNSADMRRYFENSSAPLIESSDLFNLPDFIKELAKVIKSYDIKISFGSDAHLYKHIGDISMGVDLFHRTGFKENRALNFLKSAEKMVEFSIN